MLVGYSKINGSLKRNLFSGSDKALRPLKVALICRYIIWNPGLGGCPRIAIFSKIEAYEKNTTGG